MKATKIANYSEADIRTMGEMYTGEDNVTDVLEIAAELGKTTNSVRAKLAQMKIYVKAEATSKQGSTKITKTVKAVAIGKIAELNEVETEALAKTTGAVLDKLLARLTS